MANVEVLADRLEAPELDDRSYRVVRLPNKLEALLVHDPDTDKASASVNVNVGSFSDAEDMPGMAHAVEHLLFMGTKKFPKENAYSQYLTNHSGYSNAYTSMVETNYYFEVAASSEPGPDAVAGGPVTSPLHGALDRFAQFFISPLFLAETLDRELKAVDSENKKNLQTDSWRLSQLNNSLCNPEHPVHKFSTGNLQTLRDEPQERGVDIRGAFIDFHARHYSANRMKLVVLGKESLDELQSWVADLFADVPNKDLPKNLWDHVQPYTEKEVLTQVFAKPVMDSRSLEIYFSYQDEDHLFETQPSHYISHLIGHEGPGSILAYIKAKGWANGLSAGAVSAGPGAAFFTISIRLTTEGLQNYQEIVRIVFQYISLIKENPPQEWIVDEMKGLAEVEFRFKQKSPASKFTSAISSVMHKPIPREWLLSGQKLIRKFDPDALTKALSCIRADNYRLTVISQEFPGNWDQKERWYGTEYRVERIPEDLQASVREAIGSRSEERPQELHLPAKNEFIPRAKSLTVERKEVAESSKAPRLLCNDEGTRLWWKKDDRFWIPKGSYVVSVRSPLAGVTPANTVMANLYCHLVKDALVEYSYDAELAGLDYDLSSDNYGITFQVSGYNDKMPVLLEKVLRTMRDLEVKPDRFQIVKERLLRGYRNWDYQQPFNQVIEYASWLGMEQSWINEQLLAELPHITAEAVSTFYPQLLSQVHFEVLANGNIYREDALRMTDLVAKTLKSRTLPQAQWQVRRNLALPRGGDFTYRRTLVDPANVNSCIEYYLYVGSRSDQALRAKVLLLAQLTDEQGFDQLRTKEQLGYIVFTGTEIAATTIGYRVIIQSERSATYLEERVNAFLALAGRTLESMSQEEFESHKRSVISRRLEKLKNLSAESSRFWVHIMSEYYHFLQVDSDVAHLRPLTKADMVEFFNHYIHPTSSHRAKLSIHVVSQSNPKETTETMTPGEQKSKLIGLVTKYLTAMGVGVREDKLLLHFEHVDITGGDQAAMINAMLKYLDGEEDVPAEQSKQIIQQARQLLATALPTLGIEAKAVNDEDKTLPKAPQVKQTTWIDSVSDFKASLELTAGPKPVVDLGQYEELEPKL